MSLKPVYLAEHAPVTCVQHARRIACASNTRDRCRYQKACAPRRLLTFLAFSLPVIYPARSCDPPIRPSNHPPDPSIHPSIHPFIHPSIHINASIHPSFRPFTHLSIHQFIHQCTHHCINSSNDPSILPSITESAHPSIHPFTRTAGQSSQGATRSVAEGGRPDAPGLLRGGGGCAVCLGRCSGPESAEEAKRRRRCVPQVRINVNVCGGCAGASCA